MLNPSVTASTAAQVTYPQHTIPCHSTTLSITAQIHTQTHLPFLAQSLDPIVVTYPIQIPQVSNPLSRISIDHYHHAHLPSMTPHLFRETPAARWLRDRILVISINHYHAHLPLAILHPFRERPALRWLRDRVLVITLPGSHSCPSYRPSLLNGFVSPFCRS